MGVHIPPMIRNTYPEIERPAQFDPTRFKPDQVALYSTMNFEKDQKNIAGYLRTGGCTAGCGACCTAFVMPLGPDSRMTADDFSDVTDGHLVVPIDPVVIGRKGFDDWERWLGLHDVTLFYLPSGTLVAALPVACEEPSGPMTTDAWYVWLEQQKNVSLIRRGTQVLIYIEYACRDHTEEGTCALFDTNTRPALCSAYPRHPSDIWGLDSFCTYAFRPVDQVELMAHNILSSVAERSATPKKQGKKKSKSKRKKKHGRR